MRISNYTRSKSKTEFISIQVREWMEWTRVMHRVTSPRASPRGLGGFRADRHPRTNA